MEKSRKNKEKFNTMSLQKVKAMLGFEGKGFRSVLRWCLKKEISVFGDGRRKRILESEWISTQQKDLVHAIKLAHPSTWVEELKRRGIQMIYPTENSHYSAQSSEAIKILKNWDDE
jgi:hypothetical protein